MEWHQTTSPKKNKPKTMPADCKIMAIVFWDATGCILVKILPQGETINPACYLQTLNKLHCALHDKCPWKRSSCNTTHNPLPFFYVWKGFQKNCWELLPHPPYSLDLGPSDNHLFKFSKNKDARRVLCNE
jgi:histone-lysine N-methyltransferase SETMAR